MADKGLSPDFQSGEPFLLYDRTHRRQGIVESFNGLGNEMKRIRIVGLIALLVSGCATQMVEKNASDSCAKQEKKAFLFDTKQSGIPLFIESASASYLCVGPDDLTQVPAPFGVQAVSASNFRGAGIFSVTTGSIADKAGIKPNDIIYEIAGRPIDRATDLRVAVAAMSPGEQAVIKLRREGGKEASVTARF